VIVTGRALTSRILADSARVIIAPHPWTGTARRHRIMTLDESSLQKASRQLTAQVSHAGYAPTHLVAVATAGIHVADHMASAFASRPIIVKIEARRPMTRLKRSRAVHAILARAPRWLTTGLRHLEYRLVTRRSCGGYRTVSMDADQLQELQPHDGSAVRALVVDDVLDSGLSLEACVEFLKTRLDSGAELKAAVLAMSLPDPKVKPDFWLYTNTTLRGPWSIDA
jgi:hypoxanthine phosphoribosyltransferase